MRPVEQRFLEKVTKTTDCWKWGGALSERGYGRFNVKGANCMAHRVAYALFVGPIPEDLHVLHRCDNPACVNPAHLFLGTHQDNMADREAKRRGVVQVGEKHPQSKVTKEQVLAIRAAHAAGEQGLSIAARFGVTPSNVSKIHRRAIWRHLP